MIATQPVMIKMKLKGITIIFFTLIAVAKLGAQQSDSLILGRVSYKSSQNVYVKFLSTSGINGDTLFISKAGLLFPALVVNSKSSISCVGRILPGVELLIDDKIFARKKIPEKINKDTVQMPVVAVQKLNFDTIIKINQPAPIGAALVQDIYGRVSVSSYANFSSASSLSSNRMQYALLVKANHLGGSKLSLDSYVTFRYKTHEWNDAITNIHNALRIYNLDARYEFTNGPKITIGRRINPLISNIGAIDGLQVEQSFRKITLGGIIGSRPDYTNYGFNFDLFQYGGFVSYGSENKLASAETTLGFMEQKNLSHIDRRFIYFQHSNNLLHKLSLFTSFEVDLFKVVNKVPKADFTFSSVYLTLRYRINKMISLSASYDALRNIIYYESYKSYIDRLIEQEMRQGLRFQTTVRLFNYMILGASSGYRFQTGTTGFGSKNLYAYLIHSHLPWIKASAHFTYTWLETSYLKSNIFGLRISRDFVKGKLFSEIEAKKVLYQYSTFDSETKQIVGAINLSWRIRKTLTLSVNYEKTFERDVRYDRIYSNVIKRF